MKKRMLLPLLVALFLCGCGSGKSAQVIVVGKTSDPTIEFWVSLKDGLNAASREMNLTYNYLAPKEEADIDGQIDLLQEAIAQKPDAIILTPADDDKLNEAAAQITAAKIPFIILDSSLSRTKSQAYVATNNFEAGIKAGQELYRLVPYDKKIAVISHFGGSTTAGDRERGVYEGFGREQQDRILGTFSSGVSQDEGFEVVRKLLNERDDIGGIVALNEFSTLGAANAVKHLKKQDEVMVVGFDSSIYEIKLLEEGVIRAMVVQNPFSMGYLGMKSARELIDGKKVEDTIYTESTLIRKETLYLPENQKLLFPFPAIK